jgi:hypothetical protein
MSKTVISLAESRSQGREEMLGAAIKAVAHGAQHLVKLHRTAQAKSD